MTDLEAELIFKIDKWAKNNRIEEPSNSSARLSKAIYHHNMVIAELTIIRRQIEETIEDSLPTSW